MNLKELRALADEGEILPNLAIYAEEIEDCDEVQDAARNYLQAEADFVTALEEVGIDAHVVGCDGD